MTSTSFQCGNEKTSNHFRKESLEILSPISSKIEQNLYQASIECSPDKIPLENETGVAKESPADFSSVLQPFNENKQDRNKV